MQNASEPQADGEPTEGASQDASWPRVLEERWVANSRLFYIQEQKLLFSNGAELNAERINPGVPAAVMVAPLIDERTMLLVREYGAGRGNYYLSFPKGAVHSGESTLEAANRELMEEAGYGARQLEHVRQVSLLPSYMGQAMDIVIARDLYEKKIPGDEPEPLEVVAWPLNQLDQLLGREEFCEAPALAAAMLLARISAAKQA